MTAPGITLRRHELLWVLEQCGAAAWPYPLAAVAWPADTEDETVLARARTEDALAGRGLLAPGPAAELLAVGTAVRDARRQVDLVRRGSAPSAAVGLAGPGGGAVLASTDHTGADVLVRPVAPGEIAAAVLALLPPLPPAPGPALEVPPPASDVTTRRRERQRLDLDAVLTDAVAWTQLGAAVTPIGVNWADDRADARIKWLDSPRGRYRLRHDRGRAAPPGSTRLVPDDAASPGTRAEVEALLVEPGRSTT